MLKDDKKVNNYSLLYKNVNLLLQLSTMNEINLS